jgi:hypothetical protein
MVAVVRDLTLVPKTDRAVVVHGFIIQEILLDHVAAVTETKNEIAQPITGVTLHDVPEDGAAADLDHGLRPELRFFSQAGSLSSAEDNDFHNKKLV